MADRKSQRNSLDLTKLRELINEGTCLSMAGKRVTLPRIPKMIGTQNVEVTFSPLEDFTTEKEIKKERYLTFEEHCSQLEADCYVVSRIRGKFPQNEVYGLVFLRLKHE